MSLSTSLQGPAVVHYSAVLAEAVYSSERPPSLDFPLLHATEIPPSTTVHFHFLPHYTYTDTYSKKHCPSRQSTIFCGQGLDLRCHMAPIAHTHPMAAAQLDDSGPPAGQSILPQDKNCYRGA